MRVRPRHSHRAFSLIEVLAALAIFGLCIVALIEGITATLSNWRLAEDKTKALMLAQNVMEEILYNGNLKAGEDGSTYDPPDERFSWSYIIDDTDITNLYSITVAVAWSANGKDNDVTLSMLRMQRTAGTVSDEQAPIEDDGSGSRTQVINTGGGTQ